MIRTKRFAATRSNRFTRIVHEHLFNPQRTLPYAHCCHALRPPQQPTVLADAAG
jgi:hypothetical protein